MKKVSVLLAFSSVFLFASISLSAQYKNDAQNSHEVSDDASRHGELNNSEPPMHVHWARGQEAHVNNQGRRSSPDMSFHGGPIMQNVVVEPIFWGSSWTSDPGDKISGMDMWYSGISSTQYARTTDEYTQSNGAHVTTAIAYTKSSYIVDGSAAPSGGPSTSTILGEVCKVIKNPQTNGYYPVYVDQPRGNLGYCAWHSAGSCGGVTVQFAFFFDLDNDAGCDPASTVSGQSEGLQALANVSGHELSEARTDPQLNAWYDGRGNENGDKCAWFFGSPFVTFSNGTKWKIQGNWSNYAYDNNLGYANGSGQHGCIDGDSYQIPTSVAPF